MSEPCAPTRQRASLVLMAVSGFAGLGYQIVWTQQCAVWLGHESAAVFAVVAAFFGGLATGAFALGPRIEPTRNPTRWYAACEWTIACWSALLLVVMAPFGAWMLRLTGVQPSPAWQWTVAFGGTFLLLLPATAAMGATLPAMERVTAALRGHHGRSIASLYASNTFGAVLGVLAAAFWLIPALGLLRTAAVCIGLNLVCGVMALLVFPVNVSGRELPALRNEGANASLWRLAVSGLLGIGYEMVAVRVLREVTEDTVYTFAMLLAVYLVGSVIGAAGYQRWLSRAADPERLDGRLLSALATACLLGAAGLWAADRTKNLVVQAFGPGATAAMVTEAVLALVAFGPPTVVMGAWFSHLSTRAHAHGTSFGRALGINLLGGAAAPWLFGVLALPWLGAKMALLLIAGGYLALIGRPWRNPVVWAPAAAALGLALWAPQLAFVDIPAGGRVLSYREGVLGSVSVVEDADGVAVMRIDNRQQEGSSATVYVDSRQAWLPLLLHPAPGHALFLGLGTGVTASAAAQETGLEVDAVELLPEVIAAAAFFAHVVAPEPAPRLHVMAADARRYVRASDRHYDVIVADNFHPARSGSGALYTVEHFQAVRQRLAADGVFCQWLPLHQLDLQTLRSIVRSFLAVYPRGWAMMASNSLDTPVLGLVGRRDDNRFDLDALRARLASVSAAQNLSRLGIEDEFAVLGSFLSGPQALRRFAGNAVLNTDDRPVVAYRAPRITYAPDSQPRERLIALLHATAIDPAELIAPTRDDRWPHRLAAYWVARNRFIEAGREVRPSANVQDMLAQVQEPLLAVLRISPDFRPAFEPLARMATTLAHSDAPRARALMNELALVRDAGSSSMLH